MTRNQYNQLNALSEAESSDINTSEMSTSAVEVEMELGKIMESLLWILQDLNALPTN